MALAGAAAGPPSAAAGVAPWRFAIRALQPAPQLPAGFRESGWARLKAVVASAFAQEPLAPGLRQESFRLVEAFCINGLEADLAQYLQEECAEHARARLGLLSPLAAAAAGAKGDQPGAELLAQVQRTWRQHCSAMLVVCELFLYLDQTYVRSHPEEGARCLRERGDKLFRECLAWLPEVLNQVVSLVLGLIDAQRKGKKLSSVDPGLAISMLLRLDMYDDSLEPALLERTVEFYQVESQDLLGKLAVPDYLLHCERRLAEEQARCGTDLEGRSEAELLARVRQELLGRHCDQVLEAGFDRLIADSRLEDLYRLHRLLAQVEALPALRKAWGVAIKRAGTSIMTVGDDPEESKGVIPGLVSLRRKLEDITEQAFQGCSTFSLGAKAAFEELLGASPQNRPAKLLARYVDEALHDERGHDDSEIEARITGAVSIFRSLAAKDTFEAFFRKDLAKRLLHGRRGATADADLMVVQRLRDECGASFTSKLEGMLRDVDLSRTLQSTFLEQQEVQEMSASDGIEFSISVLTSGLWPATPGSADVTYPHAVAKLQDLFAAFYMRHHTGRSLKWAPSLGQCMLRASYKAGVRKELVVSPHQALVLLLFNGADLLTCQQIAAATHIPTADLHRTLQSLSLHKTVKLILKANKAREVNDTDEFHYNADFSSKLFHIAVAQISPKEQMEEEEAVERRVLGDRQHEIDAVVVRVMKTKKRLAHQQLLAEVFHAVRFPATPLDVKQRIESLIEREYLERDTGGAAYNYLA